MTWLARVHIVLWEVSQELPTVVQGDRDVCHIFVKAELGIILLVGSLSNILLKKYYSAEAHT